MSLPRELVVGALVLVACKSGRPSESADGGASRPTPPAQQDHVDGRTLTDAERVADISLVLMQGIAAGRRPTELAADVRGSLAPDAELKNWWSIATGVAGLRIVVGETRNSDAATEAMVHADFSTRLTLEELQRRFGPYVIVHESKTSSVRFAAVPTGVTAYAGLLDSKVHPGAIVQSVTLRRDSAPAGERDTSATSQGTPRAAGGSPGNTGAPREQIRPRVISEILQYCADRVGLPPSQQDIHQDDSVALEQAKFLDHDLKVPALRRRSGVAFANVIQTVDGHRVHVGVVQYTFRRCQDLDAASVALAKIGRTNFNVAALSVFRAFRRENTLVILFSETPFHPQVRALLDSVAQEAPGSSRCEGT